jgi:hypothetical protein
MDGGNTFEMLCNLFSHHVTKTSNSFYTSDIVFIVEDGRILTTKAGEEFYIWCCLFILLVCQKGKVFKNMLY